MTKYVDQHTRRNEALKKQNAKRLDDFDNQELEKNHVPK